MSVRMMVNRAGCVGRSGSGLRVIRPRIRSHVLIASGCVHAGHVLRGREADRIRDRGLHSESKLERQQVKQRSRDSTKHRPSL